MSTENEISRWWNTLTPERRVAMAKDLNLWTEDRDWSVGWSGLANTQRDRLSKVFKDAMPDR